MRALLWFGLLPATLHAIDGVPGHCLQFSGGGWIAPGAPFAAELAGAQGHCTFEAWFSATPQEYGVLLGHNLAGGGNSLQVVVDSAGRILVYEPVGDVEIVGPAVGDGGWHHFAYARDGGTGRLWVDGVLAGEHAADFVFAATDLWSFGQEWDGAVPSQQLVGRLEELRAWTVARSEAQVRQGLHWTLAGSETGLAAVWQLNEGAGSVCVSHSGLSATLTGGAWTASDAPLGGGAAVGLTVAAPGRHDFGAACLTIEAQSVTGPLELVATRLDLAPDAGPGWPGDLTGRHWILERFGAGSLEGVLELGTAEDLTETDRLTPGRLALFVRGVNATGPVWAEAARAASVSAATDQAVFVGAPLVGQFALARDGTPALTALTPASGAIGVAPGDSLRLHFDRPVLPGAGALEISRRVDGQPLASLPASAFVCSGNAAAAAPPSLAWMESYEAVAAAGLFVDGEGRPSSPLAAGLWQWTTALPLTQVDTGLPVLGGNRGRWADLDGDGDLDMLLAGSVGVESYLLEAFNEGGEFTPWTSPSGWGAYLAAIALGDWDGDGDLDAAKTGGVESIGHPLQLFRNLDAGALAREPWALEGCFDVYPTLEFVDTDGDGDLDLFLMANDDDSGYEPVTRLFRNDGGSFEAVEVGLPEGATGDADWGDMDADGDPDLLVSNAFIEGVFRNVVLRNEGGVFVDAQAGLPDLESYLARWVDIDLDGDLDVLLFCASHRPGVSGVYRNDGGSFTLSQDDLPNVRDAQLDLGDIDGDGDFDLAITGNTEDGWIATVYRNDQGSFQRVGTGLFQSGRGFFDFGDYDGDGDLDLLQTDMSYVHLYRNDMPPANTAPSPPAQFTASLAGDAIELAWSRGADTETPPEGLTVNLQVETPDGGQWLAGNARPAAGALLGPWPGNAGGALQRTLTAPLAQTPLLAQEWRLLLCRAQSVDPGWLCSPAVCDTLDLGQSTHWLELSNPAAMGPADLLSWELADLEALAAVEVQIAGDETFAAPLLTERLPWTGAGRELFGGVRVGDLADFAALPRGVPLFWRMRPIYADARHCTLFSLQPGEFLLLEPPLPPLELAIALEGDDRVLSWPPVEATLAVYLVYAAGEADAPWPSGWTLAAPPLHETAWVDGAAAGERRFYRVKAVVLEP